jgi:hypothetical protein
MRTQKYLIYTPFNISNADYINLYSGAFGTSIIALAYLYVCRRHKANKIDAFAQFYALSTTPVVAKASNHYKG